VGSTFPSASDRQGQLQDTAFTFSGNIIQENEDSTVLRNEGKYSANGVTSRKNWIFSNTTVRTSNLLLPYLTISFFCSAAAQLGPWQSHCRGYGITLRHTTVGRPPLKRRSARSRGRYLHSTQQTQETNIHPLSGIRIRNPSNPADADLRLRPNGQWDQPILLVMVPKIPAEWVVMLLRIREVLDSNRGS
jgi:hypothetical protein